MKENLDVVLDWILKFIAAVGVAMTAMIGFVKWLIDRADKRIAQLEKEIKVLRGRRKDKSDG